MKHSITHVFCFHCNYRIEIPWKLGQMKKNLMSFYHVISVIKYPSLKTKMDKFRQDTYVIVHQFIPAKKTCSLLLVLQFHKRSFEPFFVVCVPVFKAKPTLAGVGASHEGKTSLWGTLQEFCFRIHCSGLKIYVHMPVDGLIYTL